MSELRLFFLFALFGAFFGSGAAAQAQQWFPANAVSCSLGSKAINLGVFSRISDSAPIATGDWGVDCSSNAYPQGYPNTYNTAEGGYCVTIAGGKNSRLLRGEGKNAGITIPFDFYFSRQKSFEKKYPQDYDTPIGDGTWGIAYIDWNYRNGNRRGSAPPVQVNPPVPLPGRGRFDLKISAAAAGKAYPAGIYTANFTFRWKTGSVKTAGDYPRPADGAGVCSRFPGAGGSGQISVRMEIKKYCNVAVRNHINFGKQAFLGATLTAEGQIAVECSEGTKFGVAIDDGVNSGGSGRRAMKRRSGSETIAYEIYQDKTRKKPWKSDWSASSTLSGAGSGGDEIFPVYASVPPQENKPAGIYSDILVVAVRVTEPGGN